MRRLGARATAWLVMVVAAALLIVMVTPIESAAFSYDAKKIDPVLLQQVLANPQNDFPIIVRATPKLEAHEADRHRAERAGKEIQRQGGVAKHALAIIGSASGVAKGTAVLNLTRDADVSYVFADAVVRAKFDPATGAALAGTPGILEVNAPTVWSRLGLTGRGVGVAVVDSGVYAHPDLASRIVASIDFTSATPVVSTTPLGDPGGHGTHVAGLIAGDGTASGGLYTGVAPNANVVDVRVIDATGTSNVSTIIRGLMWVLNNRATYNIKVLNMSLGATQSSSYMNDPLAGAAEVLYFAGITVVVSAGNSGPGASTITTPAIDPYVISVGAVDDMGTPATADDAIATFSSRGPTLYDGLVKPDVVAPGRKMVSLLSPGSTLDTLYPTREVTAPGALLPQYFLLSGTSMAAPVVSGIAALMYEKDPTLKPWTVRTRLRRTAVPLAGYTAYDQGYGMVDAYAATTSTLTPYFWWNWPTTSFAQDMYSQLHGQPITWYDLTFNGGVDSHGVPWSQVTWANVSWDTISWENISWEAFTWQNITWQNISWENVSWETAGTLSVGTLSGTGSGWALVD